ncbi:hypothetical protein DdX_11268 [Ditylenchus destructor]|uniref:Uncharacterized protein n=1 Tax=Ditylenchus destructor TaxID=166010 RepID=A0AAD4N2W2_9BILA|nr:hypothetical protein DdX_11268 [Ditylenchus destructor]
MQFSLQEYLHTCWNWKYSFNHNTFQTTSLLIYFLLTTITFPITFSPAHQKSNHISDAENASRKRKMFRSANTFPFSAQDSIFQDQSLMRLCSESVQKLPKIPAPFQCCWKWTFGIWRLLENARCQPGPSWVSSDRNPRRRPFAQETQKFSGPTFGGMAEEMGWQGAP